MAVWRFRVVIVLSLSVVLVIGYSGVRYFGHGQFDKSIQKVLPSRRMVDVSHVTSEKKREITLVTAYFDIGDFKKGTNLVYTQQHYMNWIKSFQHLNSYVVFYSDSERFIKDFKDIRKKLTTKTVTNVIHKNSSWAFGLQRQIQAVFDQPGYPKFHPNTIKADYACAQFAKYDVVEKAIKANHFQTSHFAWLDVGYFREYESNNRPYSLSLPSNFSDESVAFTQVLHPYRNTSMENIVKFNLVWVGGGLFVGEREIMLRFLSQFKNAVNYFIDRNLVSTDQQVLYGVYRSGDSVHLADTPVPLQVYYCQLEGGNWFLLGKHMLEYQCSPLSDNFCKRPVCPDVTYDIITPMV